MSLEQEPRVIDTPTSAATGSAENMTSLAAPPRPNGSSSSKDLADASPRRAALIAGGGYVALFLSAIVANFAVLERMVVVGDPAATVSNIAASPLQFRLGMLAFLVIAFVDVIVAWALHLLLRDVAHDRSLLTAWLRVLHSVFLGVGIAFLAQADHLVAASATAGSVSPDTAAQVALALETFDTMWMVGLAFFGLHLLGVATLLVGTRAAPRILRTVLVAAGAAYMIDTALHMALADYDTVAAVMLPVVALPSVLGEGWFGLWLFLRAGRPPSALGHRAH